MARGPLGVSRHGRRSNTRPQLGSLEFAWRLVRGGKRIVMDELAPRAVAFEPRLTRAVEKWRSLSEWQRRFVTLDDMAAEAGLAPAVFFGAIARAAFEFTGQVADLIVACAYPSVVAASVRRARTPNELADRQLIFEHVSAFRSARAEQAGQTDHRSDAETTSSMAPKFLRTDSSDDDSTTH